MRGRCLHLSTCSNITAGASVSVQAAEEANYQVTTALKCALASEKGARGGPLLGTFIADTLSPLPASAPVLQYYLPATFGVLPLMARMSGGVVEQTSGAAVVLLTVQYHVPREIKQTITGDFFLLLVQGIWTFVVALCL